VRGLNEWYEKEEAEEPESQASLPTQSPPQAQPQVTVPQSPRQTTLSGWNRSGSGLGFYGAGRFGYFSQAPAVAAPGLDPHHKLADVHPELARRITQMATALSQAGNPVTITRLGGRRTFEEQDALYAQGRTTPGNIVTRARGGQSNHNYGLAVDVVPVVNGQPKWNVANAVWQAIGDEGKRSGLNWGGDWQALIDKPHFELPVGMSVQDCLRIYRQGGLPAVWAEATRRLQNR
jgi:hypothetical protein